MAKKSAPWLRPAAFQIHLWIGLALGVYVFLICLSGSAAVFRREMDAAFCTSIVGISPSGEPIRDICEPLFVTKLVEFHDNLLGGRIGRTVNGVAAAAVALLCVTGAILWWPGRTGHWRRMTLRRGTTGSRFLRETHHALGFWLLILIFVWAASGVYFAFPDMFHALSEALRTDAEDTRASAFVEESIVGMVRLHFGRTYGMPVKVLWAILGLVPCVLFVTGTLMWWRRIRANPTPDAEGAAQSRLGP